MTFFRTPLQRRILKKYWWDNDPFTVNSLYKQGVLCNRLWGKFSLRMMLLKRQVLKVTCLDGKPMYIGTTDSWKEWDDLATQKLIASNRLIGLEGPRGLLGKNKYEDTDIYDQMIEMIEAKRKELQARIEEKEENGEEKEESEEE